MGRAELLDWLQQHLDLWLYSHLRFLLAFHHWIPTLRFLVRRKTSFDSSWI